MITLYTSRLMLRDFAESDLDDFFNYAQSPHVGPAAGWKPHETLAESRDILQTFIKEQEVWAIVLRSTGRLIGSIGLHDDIKRPKVPARMLGYVLAEAYWGQGLIPEAAKRIIAYAFHDLELEVLSVYHSPSNRRSKRVIEKCGFSYEGTLRKASRHYDGSLLDKVCYAITREEFKAAEPAVSGFSTGQIHEKSSK